MEDKWNAFGAGRPFEYNMLTDMMDEMYEAEKKLSALFHIATALTIFIALLGLLGLSSFIAEQRTKEIGIRKVVGATVGNITQLLSKEFLILILIGFVLAIPVAWWRLDIWLKDSFVYHTEISWVTFLYAGLLAFAIGILTISYHIVRAATGNPVDAIKYE
jgi:putative ABC transport system permease protein